MSAEYDLGAGVDPLVLDGVVTDVRGVIHLPSGNGHFGDGPFPLLVFMHGNHQSCRTINPNGPPHTDMHNEFASTGQCDDGRVEAPSSHGYDYLAWHMASHGYASISINTNRGISNLSGGSDDPKLILTRGRLALKHLARLYEASRARRFDARWGVDVRGQLDFGHVGMMGHSRGGEGVRAALELYQTQDPQSYASELPGLSVEGIFEFAPVDLHGPIPQGQSTPTPLDAEGAHWTVVIPSCDRDVGNFMGVGPFSRRRAELASTEALFSSVFVVPGANHNYFNTEWMIIDGLAEDQECPTDYTYIWDPDWSAEKVGTTSGSIQQQSLGIMTLSSFFRGFVADYPGRVSYQKVLDPQYRVPDQMSALVEPARESLWHDLAEVAVQLESSTGSVGTSYHETVVNIPQTGHERELTQIEWATSSPDNYYDVHLWAEGRVLDGSWILSSSLARYQDEDGDPVQDDALDVNVSLLFADGTTSNPVNLTTYVELTNRLNELTSCAPPENCVEQSRLLLFYEVPIELEDFDSGNNQVFIQPVKGLRFTFDGTPTGQLFVDRTFILRAPFKGDANADGEVNIVDALVASQFYVGNPVLPFNENAADVNCDGSVNSVDSLIIAQYYVGLIDELPCAH